MKLVLITVFFFSSFAFEGVAQELKLRCMDATGTEKSFLIFKETKKVVDKQELNLWKRGFTPQAEIWNGRMATIGIGIILIVIALISKFSSI